MRQQIGGVSRRAYALSLWKETILDVHINSFRIRKRGGCLCFGKNYFALALGKDVYQITMRQMERYNTA